ncbi:MAG: NAD(P)-dependent oxidoreductase [Gemmatimonadaceae bacterium]|nr:NAD(P)-dependent oxidoreductase [Gemmatimonadaceae bacterium]
MKVAFLGLGAIGAPMARHLASRYTLSVWNRTAERAVEFARATGSRAAASPADAVRGATLAVTCLPTSREVEQLLEGPEGMLAAFDAGATLVDCTSGDPATSRRIAERLAARGVGFVDAPVSGGVSGAVKGILTIMCGGDESAMQRARPVLEAFGEKIVHCGPVGAGHAVKAVNQALLGIHIWSLSEGLVALEKAGVSTATALDVINASSGRSNTSMNLFPERVMTRAFPRTFRLALMDKDVRIAADFAREHGVPSPLLQLASELLREARRELGEEADHVETVKVLEAWAGVQVGQKA